MAEHAGEPGAGPPLADETRKLLTAVQEWAQRAMPEPPSGHAGPECEWCPLCQFASILRGERPELADRVAEAGAALAAAFRALVDNATSVTRPVRPHPGGSRVDAGDESRPPRPSPSPRVQRVRLDDTGEA